MSIKLTNEVKALHERVDKLEQALNLLNPEPRKVAGISDPDPKPAPKRTRQKTS